MTDLVRRDQIDAFRDCLDDWTREVFDVRLATQFPVSASELAKYFGLKRNTFDQRWRRAGQAWHCGVPPLASRLNAIIILAGMADRESEEQFRTFQREIRASIRRNHPNPDRIGCVGTETLSRVARRELPPDDPAYSHVIKCSPCYEELMAVTEQAEAAHRRAKVKHRRAVLMLVGAAVIIVVAVGFLLLRGPLSAGRGTPEPAPVARNTPPPAVDLPGAVLNLESGRRGGEEDKIGRSLQRLPRKRVSLRIYLPLGMEDGHYEVMLDRGSGPPLLQMAGDARMEDGIAVLRIRPDFAGLAAGQYRLRYRRDEESWREATILLE